MLGFYTFITSTKIITKKYIITSHLYQHNILSEVEGIPEKYKIRTSRTRMYVRYHIAWLSIIQLKQIYYAKIYVLYYIKDDTNYFL